MAGYGLHLTLVYFNLGYTMWGSLERVFRRVLAYRGRARGSCRNCLNDGVDIVGS